MKFYVQLLLIFALVSATVSPACQFISGQSLMELCGTFENKQASVDPALIDFFASKDSDEEPQEKPQIALTDCAFCFSYTHLHKNLTSDNAALPTFYYLKLNMEWGDHALLISKALEVPYPRGPPSTLV